MNRKVLENKLIKIAELDSTYRSSKAMNILRNYFDSTYKWCQDCDFMVVKEKDCCLINLLKLLKGESEIPKRYILNWREVNGFELEPEKYLNP